MKQQKKIWISLVVLAAGVLLSGCGKGEPEAYAYGPEQMDAFLAELPQERQRAEPFAADLCVVTGEEPGPDVSVGAQAAGVFPAHGGGEAILQRNVFQHMNPASTTKIMTALIAVREADLDELVTVGDEVKVEPGSSLCHVNPGDTLTMEQLLYGLMLPSGNDAAAAIAVHMAGSIEAFCEKMNATAREIGATDSHFVNPHGLTDEQHYTTAYDLYLIFREAMEYPEFAKIVQTTSYTASYTDGEGNPKTQEWKNSNQYLSGETQTPEGLTVTGGKTGTTSAAGSCLVLGCEDGEQQDYIAVVLKAEDRTALYKDMTNMIQNIVN